jgi:hypothetical protein
MIRPGAYLQVDYKIVVTDDKGRELPIVEISDPVPVPGGRVGQGIEMDQDQPFRACFACDPYRGLRIEMRPFGALLARF